MDSKDFRKQGYAMIDRIAAYYEHIEKYKVLAQSEPGSIKNKLSQSMPANGEPFETIAKDIDSIIMPGITHWQHPGFMAMFPSNASFPSILGELFVAGLGINAMFWDTSPAAAELEEQVLNWLRDATGLPHTFKGVIHDTASSSTFTAIICAREKISNYNINENGYKDFTSCTIYCSNQAHYSIEKGGKAAGIGKNNIRKIDTDKNFAMDINALEKSILSDIQNGKKPMMAVATLGTTNSLAFDPLFEIGNICKKYNVWLHVDAAYAGSAFILPEYQFLLKGIEQADSYVMNAHKWLMTNFDCSCFYVQDDALLINTFSNSPDYINATSEHAVRNYKDWGLPLGRRFRALKLWFVLRNYGLNGLQTILRNHIAITETLYVQFVNHPHWEIMAPFAMNVICVRYITADLLTNNQVDIFNEQLLKHINQSGNFYLTGTKLNGHYVLRIVPAQQHVTQQHTDKLFAELNAAIDQLLH